MNNPGRDFPSVVWTLPEWVRDRVPPGLVIETIEDRMRLAIELATENVRRRTGGPFAAVVSECETGRIVAVGVNLVVPMACSLAHGEAMAVAIAQKALGNHDLAAPEIAPMELATSAQPCCQCFGVLWWSGIRRLVVGARATDVESISGFQEGPLPDHWADQMRHRDGLPPVDVRLDVLREAALEPLRLYADSGMPPYNPGTPES